MTYHGKGKKGATVSLRDSGMDRDLVCPCTYPPYLAQCIFALARLLTLFTSLLSFKDVARGGGISSTVIAVSGLLLLFSCCCCCYCVSFRCISFCGCFCFSVCISFGSSCGGGCCFGGGTFCCWGEGAFVVSRPLLTAFQALSGVFTSTSFSVDAAITVVVVVVLVVVVVGRRLSNLSGVRLGYVPRGSKRPAVWSAALHYHQNSFLTAH